jgi:NAD(P)-dependent dehydrogenase (short-subunit alcohol dehydrogenase family)
MTILDKFSLEDRVAVVTGGGTGLGKAICHAFARAGADIVVAGRRLDPISQTEAEVKELGQRAMAISTDVTDSRQVDALVEKAVREFGKVDILVNNAGIARGIEPSQWDSVQIKVGPIWELNDEKWHRALDVNLGGAFYCCRAVAEHMIKQKSGKIINMASVGGLRGAKGWITYSSAKGGVVMLTRVLAVTWARDNIQVNCIAPGFIEVVEQAAASQERNLDFIPMGRSGDPKDVGLLAVYLASQASDYVTGECFAIDGSGTVGYAPTGYAPVTNMSPL